jgi:hypothetical protein
MPPMPISKESGAITLAVSGIREAFVMRQKNQTLANAQWLVAITLF